MKQIKHHIVATRETEYVQGCKAPSIVSRYQLISYIDIHVVASKVSSIQFLCFGQGIRSLESIYAIICEIIPSLVLMMRMDLLVHDEFRRKKI
jgi:hypothetical protein